MSNGYHEAPACEHRYSDGQVCDDPAMFVLFGLLFCESHFEDRITSAGIEHGEARAAELRFAAKPVPA